MKKQFLLGLTLFLGWAFGTAQDNCSAFYPMIEGASYQYNMFNGKGKLEGSTSYLVSDVKTNAGNTNAAMNLKFEDAKGKNAFESDYTITCTQDGIKIDFKSLFPTQMMQQYENMNVEMDITGTDVELPNNLSVGQDLADANVNIKMSMSGMNMNMAVNTTDRKVIAKESVTTPAGTFDCYVISSNIASKVMMANVQMTDKLWLSEGVGIVKQESYNKKGKLESTMELVSFSK
ncbi:MAG: hypothetical protein AAGC45_11405 [Bacteroidota bacterium]